MAHILVIDYILRSEIGGASLPEPEDYVDIGSRSIVGLHIPADWTGEDLGFQYDLGDSISVELLSKDYTGLDGTVDTFTRTDAATMMPGNRIALHPDAAEAEDRLFRLILTGLSQD